jgi:hypothetical protein
MKSFVLYQITSVDSKGVGDSSAAGEILWSVDLDGPGELKNRAKPGRSGAAPLPSNEDLLLRGVRS